MCMIYMGDLLHWFSSVTLSWLEPSLSFEISVHDSRSYSSPALNKAWCVFLNQAIGGSSESSCSFVSGGCWQVLAEWEVRWCQGEPCLCGVLHVNSKGQSDLTEKCRSSCTCLPVCMELCHFFAASATVEFISWREFLQPLFVCTSLRLIST